MKLACARTYRLARNLSLLLPFATPMFASAESPSPRVVVDFGDRYVAASTVEGAILSAVKSHDKPSSLTIRHARITGVFDLSEWDLPLILRFSGCTFGGDASFERFHTERSLLFDRCVFAGRANISEVHIGRDFMAEACRFAGKKPTIAARDNEPTTFIHSRIGDDFSLNNSIFDGTVNLKHLDVGRDLYLQNAEFQGGMFDGKGGGKVNTVDLAGTQIGHFLRVDGVFETSPSTCLKITDCHFAAIFAQLHEDTSSRPHDKTGDQAEEGVMLTMLASQEYHAESYSLIEHEFVRRGRQDLADDVYIAGKDRETGASDGFDRLRLLVLAYVAGYGRKPALAFTWCLLTVLVGALVFVRDEGGPKDRKRLLRSFWYSLDLFVPIVSVSGQAPKPPKSPFARSYVRIHRLAGWLLLPIALAAISGIVGKG